MNCLPQDTRTPSSGAWASNTCPSLSALLGAFQNYCFPPVTQKTGLLKPWRPVTWMLKKTSLKRSQRLVPQGEGIKKHKQGEEELAHIHTEAPGLGSLQSLSLLGVQKSLPLSHRLLGSRSEPQRTQAINQMHKMWLGSHPVKKIWGFELTTSQSC